MACSIRVVWVFTLVFYIYILSYVYNIHVYIKNININAFPHAHDSEARRDGEQCDFEPKLVMRFQARAPQRFSPSTTHTESCSIYPCDIARSTKFGALSEWESLSFSFALVDYFYASEADIFSAWILSRATMIDVDRTRSISRICALSTVYVTYTMNKCAHICETECICRFYI